MGMHKEIFTKLTDQQLTTSKSIEHNTINFFDDSTNIISTKNASEIQDYLNQFYLLFKAVYNINKLKINNDKTLLMIICKRRFRANTKNIQMVAKGHKVKQVQHVKILGYIIRRNLQNDRQINKTISNINNRLFNIKKLGNKSTFETRKILVKSIVIGKLNYAPPLLSNSTQAQLQILNTQIIKSCQTILGN